MPPKIKKTDSEIKQDKTNRIMNIIAQRCAYYRANPSRFLEDWIPGLKLKWFQKIILWAMAHNDMFYIISAINDWSSSKEIHVRELSLNDISVINKWHNDKNIFRYSVGIPCYPSHQS